VQEETIMRILILSLALLATTSFGPAAVAQRQDPAVEVTEDVWKGALVDWDCKQADPEPACGASLQTKHFALSIDGGVLLYFDEHGNELAAKAVSKAGAAGDAIVIGVREGRLLKVESVRIGSVEIS
jgi:hypothetical protein